jgi:hypothetical protein
MKRIFIVLLFLLLVGCIPFWGFPVIGAENSCESAKIYKVCGANIEDKPLYTVTTDDCSKVNHIGYFYRIKRDALDVADMQNASAYSSCETDRDLKKSNKEIDEAKWVEVN